ncbi:MAG: PHP domain-containing protein [Treponema sp.]|jgi:hypothetical protein|nr:PHP domain-containing protein [Treponema sp.]
MINYPPELNDPVLNKEERLAALRSWQKTRQGVNLPKGSGEINNHIHTIYSFSPYSPVMAALRARDSGLTAAGSVDHDSIAAALEMLEAAAILGIGGCVGFELRVSFKTGADGSPSQFAMRKINNPDSEGFAYMTVQGIPRPSIPAVAEFLKPVREQRLKRTRAMTTSANAILREAKVPEIDFEPDIYGKSKYAEGGEVTERHLLAAIADKFILKYGKGRKLAEALREKMGISVSPNIAAVLLDKDNPHYLYDLLGVFKSELLPGIFIQPDTEECITADSVTSFAESVGAVAAYAYLGDVGVSPTGDKKAEKFEDDFIEELFAELSRLGYRAVTYMPPRNTAEQLRRVQRLCAEWGFMEISGVDINSSRQSFNCPEVLRDEFRHLLDTTWALIAHERLASIDKRFGLFSTENPLASESLTQRLKIYAVLGKRLDLFHPEESAASLAVEIEKGRC